MFMYVYIHIHLYLYVYPNIMLDTRGNFKFSTLNTAFTHS